MTFRPFTVAALPAVEGVDTVVLDTTIDPGMSGVVTAVLFQWTGSGLEYASGDLIWRVRIGRWFAKGLENVDLPLGNLARYFEYGGRERLYSKQRVRVYAYLGSGALSRLSPDGRIISSLDGHIWPDAAWRA